MTSPDSGNRTTEFQTKAGRQRVSRWMVYGGLGFATVSIALEFSDLVGQKTGWPGVGFAAGVALAALGILVGVVVFIAGVMARR